MNDPFTKESKFLSLVLRHKPETLGVTLDEQGWASVENLVTSSRNCDIAFSRKLLSDIVANCNKQRFQFNEDKSMIRCHQGHSLDIKLGLNETEPPDELFHGTATRFLESILAEGLKKKSRHHVHLSSDIDTARAVGSRYGKVIILRISAREMFKEGHVFYLSGNGVWLTDSVPSEFIKRNEDFY
jgi:putative RNA 2'-phosphotransferase